MPYKIVEQSGQFVVENSATGKVMGKHPTQDKAKAQLAALYASDPGARKSMIELKAEPFGSTQLDSWLSGNIPRRVLVVPYGGPLPGGKKGKDLDGDYFDEESDLYGHYAGLRQTRERLVDWHHDNDPTGGMTGAILGKAILDENPEADGLWADFWANAGEKRRQLIATLEQRHVPLYGSSQAIWGAVRKADDGHIDVWPLYRHTITTSPQNTLAVVPPLKAVLESGLDFDGVGWEAIQAALLGMSDEATFSGGGAHLPPERQAYNKESLEQALDLLADYVRRQ